MLYMFDMDGTIVHDYLHNVRCTKCGGGDGSCTLCKGRGQLLEPDPERPYADPSLLPWRWEALQALAEGGNRFALITNQAGVALGFQTRRETHLRIGLTLGLIDYFGGMPFTVHICFDHPHATVEPWKGRAAAAEEMPLDEENFLYYRKPEPGMIRQALSMHRANPLPGDAIYVGDRDVDEKAAAAANVPFAYAKEFF